MGNNSDFWEQQARQNSTKAHTAKLETTSALSDASRAKLKTYYAELETREVNQENQSLNSKISAAEDENERYRAIHARPLMDILQELTDLKLAYKEQQNLLNEWVVSQKAFRDLVYKFRKELGISDEKIKELVKEAHSKNGKLA